MATSGSADFTVTRTEIIEEAIAEVGNYDPGNPVPSDEAARANRRLNMMIQRWMAKSGFNLWRRQEVTCFVNPDQMIYTFGTDHITASYTETTTSVAASSTDTSVTLTAVGTIAENDYIGVRLDDASVQWTTVDDVTGSVVTLDAALTDDVASGNIVYYYTTKATSPKKIKYFYRKDTSDNDSEVIIVGRYDYELLGNKDSDGEISQVYHDPQLAASKIRVWPATGTSVDKLVLIVDRRVEDFDSAANTPDFPSEWYEALYLGLAHRLAPVYGLSVTERRALKIEAEEAFFDANTFDQEESSTRFEMDLEGQE